ncbi:MAG TPA: methylmalonyl-CoA mutase family protein, partial [Gemmatimonadales bacterium]|nr:methylmalonyl-CoA mutase family protein [Gemmatimonadales bacterium]
MTARREDRRSKPSRRLSEQEVELERLRSEVAAWRARAAGLPVRADAEPISSSGRVVEPVYTALDLPSDVIASTGLPGNFPYTRGIHPTMYRGRLWTMR